MIKSYNFNLNKFFRKISLKKQYTQRLAHKALWLANITEQSYKRVNYGLLLKNRHLIKHKSLIRYIINISFARSNTSLHITDFSGALKFGCSAGNLSFTGKNKRAKTPVLKAIIRILNQKLKMLKKKPVALHLKNVGSKRFWITQRLKEKLFIKVIRCFNAHPHNGCRKRKTRRKKFKKKSITKRNGWAV
jgi:ribosomal protein S11